MYRLSASRSRGLRQTCMAQHIAQQDPRQTPPPELRKCEILKRQQIEHQLHESGAKCMGAPLHARISGIDFPDTGR